MKPAVSVIPAAGLGTRMLPLSAAGPKELLPLGDQSMLQWTALEARRAGVEKFVLVTSPTKSFANFREAAERYPAHLARAGGSASVMADLLEHTQWTEALQKEPLGLGHAVLQARDTVGTEPFWVQLPDEWYPAANSMEHMLSVWTRARQEDPNILVAIGVVQVPLEQVQSYGIAAPAAGTAPDAAWFHADALVEKPLAADAPSRYAIIGRYILDPAIFSILESLPPGRGNEIQLTDALDQLAARRQLICIPYEGLRFDTGNLAGYTDAWSHWLAHRNNL